MTNIFFPVILMLLISGTSSIPMGGSAEDFKILTSLSPNIQNMLHIPVFGLLAYLWMRALCNGRRSFFVCWTMALAMTVAFGIIDEIHQMFVPGRYAGLLDAILNTIGAVCGIVFFAFRQRAAVHG